LEQVETVERVQPPVLLLPTALTQFLALLHLWVVELEQEPVMLVI
jgi:hypothetical protein